MNPFLNHQLVSISLNSISKWRARVLPSFKDYYAEHGKIARNLTIGFSYLMALYSTLKEKDGYALLRVKIDTGRKNQIRVHLSSLGCPVVWDDKYGKPKDVLKRLGLHASKLEFYHPDTGELMSITSTMPPFPTSLGLLLPSIFLSKTLPFSSQTTSSVFVPPPSTPK